jgi:hypothetical protein
MRRGGGGRITAVREGVEIDECLFLEKCEAGFQICTRLPYQSGSQPVSLFLSLFTAFAGMIW